MPEQLEYMHDLACWRRMAGKSQPASTISVHEMGSNQEMWADWLKQENEYAANDRA